MATRRSGTWMTVTEFCAEMVISRSTFDDWRAKGRAPKAVRLPNGSLRIKRTDFENWLDTLEADAA
ncbi:helix-turn-helix domain-containing protein [Saccharopolyspora sp. HNM0983]|uniref:Helix-turn-helix domain-containing protein n=1 Tax=Saccharopolyspora montiporae TaxID=2781240 RepID=A0A929BDF3_9PSEU|nr:helix-turn-helix domain-containing protein [Saccharopolyspora sp. HNM0983]MBE9375573.1 helix-turn-helix domain-containing protein [Saccharopolyspora sp. HNM0983]